MHVHMYTYIYIYIIIYKRSPLTSWIIEYHRSDNIFAMCAPRSTAEDSPRILQSSPEFSENLLQSSLTEISENSSEFSYRFLRSSPRILQSSLGGFSENLTENPAHIRGSNGNTTYQTYLPYSTPL